jgi:hypothetical protein
VGSDALSVRASSFLFKGDTPLLHSTNRGPGYVTLSLGSHSLCVQCGCNFTLSSHLIFSCSKVRRNQPALKTTARRVSSTQGSAPLLEKLAPELQLSGPAIRHTLRCLSISRLPRGCFLSTHKLPEVDSCKSGDVPYRLSMSFH